MQFRHGDREPLAVAKDYLGNHKSAWHNHKF